MAPRTMPFPYTRGASFWSMANRTTFKPTRDRANLAFKPRGMGAFSVARVEGKRARPGPGRTEQQKACDKRQPCYILHTTHTHTHTSGPAWLRSASRAATRAGLRAVAPFRPAKGRGKREGVNPGEHETPRWGCSVDRLRGGYGTLSPRINRVEHGWGKKVHSAKSGVRAR